MPGEEFQVTVHPAAEGGFWATVDGLPGCMTQAESYTEVLERLRDAHRSWLRAPAPAPAAPAPPPPGGVPATAGEAAAWLAAGGWVLTRQTVSHLTYVRPAPPARLTLPRSGEEVLKGAYREELARLASS